MAVNGVCLTAVGICGDRFGADVMHETLRRSALGDVAAGANVNLELALRASDRLGGHIVQGHVDGVGAVAAVREDGFARVVTILAGPEVLRYVVEKGSIAVDGVSLTVARIDGEGFDVSLIPETLERTTLGSAVEGHAGEPRGRRPREVRREAPRAPTAAGFAKLLGMSPTKHSPFATIEEALEDIRQGKMVVVCDDEDRENEGDLTMAAQFATPEAVNFMAKEGRGLICLSLTAERCEELGLDLMAAKNESPFETPFTVSIEAREGVTTGISAPDRARTIQVAIDPESSPARPRPAGPRLPAEEPRRRRARARRPDRGRRRPRPPRRAEPRRRHLRGHERRRHDGPRRRPRRVLQAPRPEDGHRRRPHRLPAPPRQARRARRVDEAADRLRRLRGRRLPRARRRQAPRRARQGRGRRRARTSSSGCTPSASPATSSTRCAAIAASSSRRPWR